MTQKCQEIFDQLKYLLILAPTLKIVDPNKEYIIGTNSSLKGLCGVLMQDNYVIGYESRKLKEREKNYVVYDLELVAVIHALKMWWRYLLGNKFTLVNYHINLKYFFSQQYLNTRQVRWMAFLGKFDFDIKQIKGNENKIAYALSRSLNQMYEIFVNNAKIDLNEHIIIATLKNQEYKQIQEKMINETCPTK